MKIFTIESGWFSTDGGAMFGVMSRKVWATKYPVDQDNRCPLAMRCLFVDFGEHKVLFDAGVGNKPTGMPYYRFHHLTDLEQALAREGYSADDVTDVVLSHLHFDHCGGCTKALPDGRVVMTFPHAVHWASRGQWENSLQPHFWEYDAYLRENMEAVQQAGKLRLVQSDCEPFDGLRLKLFQGHTSDQLASFIQTDAGNLVFSGDVVPMCLHVTQGCIAAIDNHALESADEKMRLLREACDTQSRLVFYHDATTESAGLRSLNGHLSATDRKPSDAWASL